MLIASSTVVKVGDVQPLKTNLCLVVRVVKIEAVAATCSKAVWVAVVGDDSASIDLVVTRKGTWRVCEAGDSVAERCMSWHCLSASTLFLCLVIH
jgi:hypothetical protein